MILFLAMIVLGSLMWMKKYYQAFLALMALFSISCCVIGLRNIDSGSLAGTILIAVGLGALFRIGLAAKRLYFRADKSNT